MGRKSVRRQTAALEPGLRLGHRTAAGAGSGLSPPTPSRSARKALGLSALCLSALALVGGCALATGGGAGATAAPRYEVGGPPDGVPPSPSAKPDANGTPPPLWQATTVTATSVFAFDGTGEVLGPVDLLDPGIELGVWGIGRDHGWLQVSPWGRFVRRENVEFASPPDLGHDPEPAWQGRTTAAATIFGLNDAGERVALGSVPDGTQLGIYGIDYDAAVDRGVVQTSAWIQFVDVHQVHVQDWTFPWEMTPTPVPTGSYRAAGLSGREVIVRAGRDRRPVSCPACVYVEGGHIKDPDGRVFLGVGANMPLLRDGQMSGLSWAEMSYRNVRVIRMFAAGSHLSNDNGSFDDWADRVAAHVEEAYGYGIRVIVSFADYYHPLPGEQLVADNYYRDDYNFCGIGGQPDIAVRPWPWYRRGVPQFDFQSACHNKARLISAPNYEVHYLPFVRAIVQRLANHPGVFAWAVGNELRALGRGGADGYRLSQGETVEVFAGFLDHVIAEIRTIDPNHMIIPGVQNVTEVADEVAGGPAWKGAFDRMLEVPFDAWNLTIYDDNGNSRADVPEMRRYGVPVIATEFDYWSCQYGELAAKACGLADAGVSLFMPWSRDEMTGQCGAAVDGAWATVGYLGGTRLPDHQSCGSHDASALPIPAL